MFLAEDECISLGASGLPGGAEPGWMPSRSPLPGTWDPEAEAPCLGVEI